MVNVDVPTYYTNTYKNAVVFHKRTEREREGEGMTKTVVGKRDNLRALDFRFVYNINYNV